MITRPNPKIAALVDAIHRDDALAAREQLDQGAWGMDKREDLIGEAISMGSPGALAELARHARAMPKTEPSLAAGHMRMACVQGRVDACDILLARGWPLDAHALAYDVLYERRRCSGRRVRPMDRDMTCRFPGLAPDSKLTWGDLHAGAIEWLAPRIARVDEPVGVGRSPDHTLLMMSGGGRCARALLASGANPNVVDRMGWTATAHALVGGSKEWIQALIEGGADLGLVAPGCDAVAFATGRAGRPAAALWALAAARAAIAGAIAPGAGESAQPRRARL